MLNVALNQGQRALSERAAVAQLTSVSNVTRSEVEAFAVNLQRELFGLAASTNIAEATREFTAAFPTANAQLPVSAEEARAKVKDGTSTPSAPNTPN